MFGRARKLMAQRYISSTITRSYEDFVEQLVMIIVGCLFPIQRVQIIFVLCCVHLV